MDSMHADAAAFTTSKLGNVADAWHAEISASRADNEPILQAATIGTHWYCGSNGHVPSFDGIDCNVNFVRDSGTTGFGFAPNLRR